MSEKKTATDKQESEAGNKRTPEEWMARLGRFAVSRKIGKTKRYKIPHWQHACADAMGGWSQHAHDANEPFRLTQDDYEGALKAAEGAAPYKPPKGAISPYCTIQHDAKPGAKE